MRLKMEKKFEEIPNEDFEDELSKDIDSLDLD